MLDRVALALALIALAPAVVAQGAAADPAPSSAPVSSSTPPRSNWEWGVGATAGRRSGWWAPGSSANPGFGWVIEADVLGHLGERAVLGAMISSGLALEALAGVRFRLSPGLRLDLLADGGVTRQELWPSETYWAPTVGARAGLAWARREGGRYVTAGVAVRHRVPEGTVPVLCADYASSCGRISVGGGTLVGAFVTFGSARGAR